MSRDLRAALAFVFILFALMWATSALGYYLTGVPG